MASWADDVNPDYVPHEKPLSSLSLLLRTVELVENNVNWTDGLTTRRLMLEYFVGRFVDDTLCPAKSFCKRMKKGPEEQRKLEDELIFQYLLPIRAMCAFLEEQIDASLTLRERQTRIKDKLRQLTMMIVLLLFLQKQSLAFAVYLFGIGTLHLLLHVCVCRC
jgi:hypothetical protein